MNWLIDHVWLLVAGLIMLGWGYLLVVYYIVLPIIRDEMRERRRWR